MDLIRNDIANNVVMAMTKAKKNVFRWKSNVYIQRE